MDTTHLFSEYFLSRLLINTVTLTILIRVIYYSIYRKHDLFFPYFLLNFIIFLLAYMFEKAKAFGSLYSAFGLLAAFSLLRFRTETISAKDMTYLFIVMALGLINSVMKGSFLEVAFVNGLILVAVFTVDGGLLMKNQKTKTIEFDGIENLQPEKHKELIEILRQRTGINIQRVTIEHIDYVRQRTRIRIYYY